MKRLGPPRTGKPFAAGRAVRRMAEDQTVTSWPGFPIHIERAADTLIADGFVAFRTNADGTVEIVDVFATPEEPDPV